VLIAWMGFFFLLSMDFVFGASYFMDVCWSYVQAMVIAVCCDFSKKIKRNNRINTVKVYQVF